MNAQKEAQKSFFIAIVFFFAVAFFSLWVDKDYRAPASQAHTPLYENAYSLGDYGH